MRLAALALALLAGCAAPVSGRAEAGPEAPTEQAAPAEIEARPAPETALAEERASPAPDWDETEDPRSGGNAAYDAAMESAAARQLAFPQSSERVRLTGRMTQGGLVFGETLPGARVRLDGDPVMVGADGRFVVGFGRDSALSALLLVELPGGAVERIALKIEDRDFPVQRIDGLDQSRVSGFTEEQLKKIAADQEKKKAARIATDDAAHWAAGFDWPARGRISGVFGSQRILNGEKKTPHSGLDVAAPAGTPVVAPADGIVRLAEPDMYFEGGLVLLDHGHWVESAFLHLSRLDVAAGQKVKKGEPLGAIGATGRATGPHLHWSVKWTGRLVDPQLLVPAEENREPAP